MSSLQKVRPRAFRRVEIVLSEKMFFQGIDSQALVVLLSLRHAPRRHCLKSHPKQEAAMPCKRKTKKFNPAHRKMERGLMHPTRFQKRNMPVWCKLMSPRGIEWNHLYLNIRTITSQAKDATRSSTFIWYKSLFLCRRPRKSRMRKAAVDKEWNKLETFPAWQLDRFNSKKGGYSGDTERQKEKSHFAALMDMSSQKCGVGTTISRSARDESCSELTLFKDDSGAYVFSFEQGSSASQTTAAKVMDVIARLPDCERQAADASTCLYAGQNGRCSKIFENSQIGMSRYVDTSFHDIIWPRVSVKD